jgi:hypothetical protein
LIHDLASADAFFLLDLSFPASNKKKEDFRTFLASSSGLILIEIV